MKNVDEVVEFDEAEEKHPPIVVKEENIFYDGDADVNLDDDDDEQLLMIPGNAGRENEFRNTQSTGFNKTNMHQTVNGDITTDNLILNEVAGDLKGKVLERKGEIEKAKEDLEKLKAPDKYWNNPIKQVYRDQLRDPQECLILRLLDEDGVVVKENTFFDKLDD